MSFWVPANFQRGFFKPPTGGSGPTLANLDPPITSSLTTKTQQAYGFDRLVEGYSGNTVTLQRVSDSAQQSFGFDSSGRFSFSDVQNWAGASNVTVVSLIDQMASGKLLAASGTVYLINTSVTRFGTSWDTGTGQLTLSSSNGGVGCRIEGGNYFQLTSSGLAASSGMMVHILGTSLERKIAANDSTDPAGLNATTTADCWFSYGLSTTNNFSYEMSGGNYLHRIRRIATGAGGTDQSITTGGRMKQNALHVHSSYTDGTNTGMFAYGRQMVNATTSAGNATANSTFSNGTFRIGRRYPGASGESTSYGTLLFGGVIITQSVTSSELFQVQSKLRAIANQHFAYSVNDVKAMFDEIMDMRDINTGTGVLTGKNGKLTLNFNLATSFGGKSPDWTLQNIINYFGLQGVKSNDDTNYANTFVATTNYFADVQTGTMVVLAHRDATGNSANYATDLGEWFADGTNSPPDASAPAQNTDFSKGIGFHHAQPNMFTKAADSLDPNNKTGTTPWNDQGGKVSQPMAKYFFNTSNGGWQAPKTSDADVTVNGVLYPSGTTITTSLLTSTIGVTPPTPENTNYDGSAINYPYNTDTLQLQVGTFTKGPNFNSNDNQTTRDLYARTGDAWHYVTPLGAQVGGLDCSVARQVGNANCVNSNANAKIQSGVYLQNVKGTRFLFGFAKTAWTIDQVEILNTNLYKLVS